MYRARLRIYIRFYQAKYVEMLLACICACLRAGEGGGGERVIIPGPNSKMCQIWTAIPRKGTSITEVTCDVALRSRQGDTIHPDVEVLEVILCGHSLDLPQVTNKDQREGDVESSETGCGAFRQGEFVI